MVDSATFRALLAADDRLFAPAQWDELLQLARSSMADDGSAALVDALSTRRSDLAARGWSPMGWDGWDTIDSARVRTLYPTPGARERVLDEILATPRPDLSRHQLHALHGLIALGDARPHRLRPIGSAVDAALMAERVASGRAISDSWVGWPMLDEAITLAPVPADPTARAGWISSELAARRTRGSSSPALGLMLVRRRDLLPVEPDAATRLAMAVEALGEVARTGSATVDEVRPILVDARRSLDDARAGAGSLEFVVDETRELVDRNLARVNGPITDESGGFLNYPDYAELGRIHAGLALIERAPGDATTSATAAAELVW